MAFQHNRTEPAPASAAAPDVAAVPLAPVAVGPAATPVEGKASSGTNTAVGIVLGVVGLGSLVTALVLDLSTTSDINSMKSPCGLTHSCSSSRVNTDQVQYDVAGVGLGVGIVAAGIATYVLLAHPFGRSAGGPSHTGQAQGPSFRLVPSLGGSGFAVTF